MKVTHDGQQSTGKEKDTANAERPEESREATIFYGSRPNRKREEGSRSGKYRVINAPI